MVRPGNADDMRRRHKERIAQAREKLGGQCAQCGSRDDLDFDHIDPTTKTGNVASMSKARPELFWAEVAKCQLLCRPCHIIKTRKDYPWHHGTLHGYVHKACRCEACSERYEQYRQQYTGETYNLKRRLARGGSKFPKGQKPHGTYAKYKSGCKCIECKKANNDYMQAYNARIRGVTGGT